MPGIVRYKLEIFTTGLETLPEVEARLQDISPMLQNLIDEWAHTNEDKFGLGKGAEETGAQMDDGLLWEPLTERYRLAKQRKGFEDWLMVRTGGLMASLTNPDGFFRAVTNEEAVFGIPVDEDEAVKAINKRAWDSRQSIFLNEKDRLAIKREFKNYLELGENYRDVLFARGMAAAARRQEILEWDTAFAGTVA